MVPAIALTLSLVAVSFLLINHKSICERKQGATETEQINMCFTKFTYHVNLSVHHVLTLICVTIVGNLNNRGLDDLFVIKLLIL